MRRILPILLAFSLFACSDGTGGTAIDDAGTTPAGDAGTDDDAGSTGGDAGATDAGTTDAGPADAGSDEDAGTSDAGPTDAGPVDAGPVTNVRGQCARSSDCGSGQTCSTGAPGGICRDCIDDSDCGGPGDNRSYTCNLGGCNLDCGSDLDCPTGMTCNSAGSCVLKRCTSNANCPAPLVCEALGAGGSKFCQRPPCDASCPAADCVGGRCTSDF